MLSYSNSSFHFLLSFIFVKYFHCSEDVTGYCRRNINCLFVPRVFFPALEREVSFIDRGTTLYNSLPSIFVEAPTLCTFKLSALPVSYSTIVLYSRDHASVGMTCDRISLLKPASILPFDDMAVLVR